jgi:hypothetical protein
VASSRRTFPIEQTFAEVDRHSLIRIHFDQQKMNPGHCVEMRVEAQAIKGTTKTPIAVSGYTTVTQEKAASKADDKNSSTMSIKYTVVYIQQVYDQSIPSLVPDTSLDLTAVDLSDIDELVINVKNQGTQQFVDYHLLPRTLGFHAQTSDSLLFIQRRKVSLRDRQAGVSEVNFAASPGVTYGGIWIPRQTGQWRPFVRALSPGIGLNLSFLDWKDSAFDVTTGKFNTGTKGSDINFGLGVQASLFSGILQFTYGWNLQAETKRQYIGLGVSFVNIAEKWKALTEASGSTNGSSSSGTSSSSSVTK